MGSHLLHYGSPRGSRQQAETCAFSFLKGVQGLSKLLFSIIKRCTVTEQTHSAAEEAKPFLMLPKPITDPKGFIEEFFRQFHLHGAQEFFWEICKGALSSPNYDSAYDRSNVLFFSDLMMQFYAATQQLFAPLAGSVMPPIAEDNVTNEEDADPAIKDARELQAQLNTLTGFLSTHSLNEMERDLDTWLKVALCTDNVAYQEGKERGNLIALHDQLRALLRSLHQFSQAVKQEQLKQ